MVAVTIADRATTELSPWSPRETELLAVTLQLLQEHGYDRLTVDAVAATARASKATVYRRWPSKAELVLAAFIEGIRQVAVAPETGTLRGDLVRLGEVVCQEACQHASTIRAVLVEVSRNRVLNDVMQRQFIEQRKGLIRHVLQRAVDRVRSGRPPSATNSGICCPATSSSGPSSPPGRPPVRPCRPSSTTSSSPA